MFLFGVKKTYSLCHFLKPKNYILEANVCIFLYISVRKFLFQRILFGREWVGDRFNNLFKAAGSLDLVKYFTFIILIEIFENSIAFQPFDSLIYSIKTMTFPRQLDFRGKIVAKFLIRSHFLSI